jgi:hypothetical protein
VLQCCADVLVYDVVLALLCANECSHKSCCVANGKCCYKRCPQGVIMSKVVLSGECNVVVWRYVHTFYSVGCTW